MGDTTYKFRAGGKDHNAVKLELAGMLGRDERFGIYYRETWTAWGKAYSRKIYVPVVTDTPDRKVAIEFRGHNGRRRIVRGHIVEEVA